MQSLRTPLEGRIVDLFQRDVTPQDRTRIRDAFSPDLSFEDLPSDIRELIERLEKDLPVQSWDDPMDVPDEIYGDQPQPANPLIAGSTSAALSRFSGR